MKLLMFSKHLQDLSIDEMGRAVKELGFEGVDLTTRPGGSVLPERVGADLPRAAGILAGHGLEVGMLTTGITGADEPYAEDTFRAAADMGIRSLKLGYFGYWGFGTLVEQIRDIRESLKGLATMAGRYGVTACIHTHSGDTVPPSGELLYILLQGFDPRQIGAYIDPGHMTVEGGYSSWKMGMDLLSKHVRLVAIKDFRWFEEDEPGLGKSAWRRKLAPLREGIVRWPEVFEYLRAIGYDGYVSIHSEYKGPESWRDLSTPELLQQTRLDLEYLRGVIGSE